MRWWPLAAVAVLLFAGVLSWLLFQPRTGPTLVAAAPSAAPQPSVAVVPAAVERQPEAVASAEPLPAPPTVIVPDETVSDAPVVSTMPERPSMIDPLAPRTAAARDRSPRAVSTATVLTPPMEPPVRADAPPRSTEPARADLATRVEPPPRVDPAKTRAPVAAARNDIDVRAVAPKAATLPSRAVAAPARADARTSSVRPSFNCRRSRGDVARAICRDDELAGLDRAVAGRFAALAAGIDSGVVQAIHHGQTAFLNDRQNCTDRDCLVEVYRNRLRELDELAH